MALGYIKPMSPEYLAQIKARAEDNDEPDKEFLRMIVSFMIQERRNNFLAELIAAWDERGNGVMNEDEAKKRVKKNGFFIILSASGNYELEYV
jgi:hypothetical protein